MNENKTCLSYWFPKIRDAGLPVPKTEIVVMADEAREHFCNWVFDGAGIPCSPFFRDLHQAVATISLPAFLRTGQGSGKHSWDRCCNLREGEFLEAHVAALINWSECVDMLGLPWNVWAAREMLPVEPFGVCPRYGNMPIVKECRCFVEDGRILWINPYWPREALDQGGATLFDSEYQDLCACSHDDSKRVIELACAAGKAVGGRWSVDILDTKRGWFVTDMAEAERSYGWDEERYKALK